MLLPLLPRLVQSRLLDWLWNKALQPGAVDDDQRIERPSLRTVKILKLYLFPVTSDYGGGSLA